MKRPLKTTAHFSVLFGLAAFALTGCAAATPETARAEAAESVSINDTWVKAADEGMSAAFGELHNDSASDVTITKAATDASTMIELHETVENEAGQMVMREIEGGFVIPAGGTMTLEPGGNHIMLMDLNGPLVAGDDVTFTLTFADESTMEFTAVVKDYAGANETYEDGDSHSDGSEHGEHDEHDSGDDH